MVDARAVDVHSVDVHSVDVAVSARAVSVRSSTAALLVWLDARMWSDEAVKEPSLLPGWSRAHVLSHLARNADAIAGSLAAALRGEVRATYPDGLDVRNADIETGAARTADALRADLHAAADRLDRVIGAVTDANGWDLPAHGGNPARDLLDARWREVEIHRIDLAAGYGPADWPREFVTFLLPQVLPTAAARLSRPVRIDIAAPDAGPEQDRAPDLVAGADWAVSAWLIGRPVAGSLSVDPPPELTPWR